MGFLLRSRRVFKLRPVLLLLVAASAAGCGRKAGSDPARLKATSTAQKCVERGEDYLREGNKQKAAAAYSKAIQVDPDCQTAYVRRAMLYGEVGEHKKALA